MPKEHFSPHTEGMRHDLAGEVGKLRQEHDKKSKIYPLVRVIERVGGIGENSTERYAEAKRSDIQSRQALVEGKKKIEAEEFRVFKGKYNGFLGQCHIVEKLGKEFDEENAGTIEAAVGEIQASEKLLAHSLSLPDYRARTLRELSQMMALQEAEPGSGAHEGERFRKELAQFATGTVEENFNTIQESVANDEKGGSEAAAAIGNFYEHGTRESVEKHQLSAQALEGFIRHVRTIRGPQDDYAVALMDIMAHGPDAVADKIVHALENIFAHKARSSAASENFLLAFCYASENKKLREAAEKGLKAEIEAYKLPFEYTLTAWEYSVRSLDALVLYNYINALHTLEERRKGTTEFLFKKFGVLDYTRYPLDMLVEQCEQYNNTELPYGIVLFTHNDRPGFHHGGSSDNWGAFQQDKEIFEKIHTKLNGKYLTRIFECDSKQAVLRAHQFCKVKYGKGGHKIAFRVFGAHGSFDAMTYGIGDTTVDDYVHMSDMETPGGQRANEAIEDDCIDIFFSCSTGEKGGIAERSPARMIFAPETDASVNKEAFDVEVDEKGKLRFTVKYKSAADKRQDVTRVMSRAA
jgi:hypothetical protein